MESALSADKTKSKKANPEPVGTNGDSTDTKEGQTKTVHTKQNVRTQQSQNQ